MVVGDVDFRLWAEDGVDGIAEEMREGGSGGRSLTALMTCRLGQIVLYDVCCRLPSGEG